MTNFITRSMTAALLLSMVFMGAPIAALAADPAPTFALNGAATMTLMIGDTYTELGATATDDSDDTDGVAATDISGSIHIGGDTVNTNVAGTYVVTYEVTDGTNPALQLTRTVIVEDPTQATVSDEAEFNAALDDMDVMTITIGADFSFDETLTVDRAITIDGNGKTVTADSSVTGSGLLITGSDVTVSDLTVDASGLAIQAIQAYVATDVSLASVTAKNSMKSGIMVNGSTVTVSDVTTENNAWHGINVDQGSGVTSAAVLTVNGSSTHTEAGPDIFVDDNAKGSVVDTDEQYAQVAQAPGTAYYLSTVKNEGELADALANDAIASITLGASFEVTSPVLVDRSVSIDGNGTTITADGVDGHVVLITGSDVAISDLTVDGSDEMIHGIQAYTATNVTLTKVTVKDNGKSGLLVNGSTVTVSDLATSGNGWNGVNVDQGSGVTSPATLTVNGTSSHDEDVAIWIDDNAKTGVSVVDTNSQYTTTLRSYDVSGVTVTGTEYRLTPVSSGGGHHHHSSNNNSSSDDSDDDSSDTDTSGSVDAGEGAVLGASTYHFAANLTIGSTGEDVNQLQTILIAAGYLTIATPTGYFGPLTEAAVKLWQAAHNVPATGFVGPLTIAELNKGETPTMSDEASDMRAAQLLNLLEQLLALLQKKAAESN